MAATPSASVRHLHESVTAIERFMGTDLAATISDLEWSVRGCNGPGCLATGTKAGISNELLSAAYTVKRAAGQINVVIHAIGVMMLLPKILEEGEHVEYVSLGAGNTGKEFDLATDRRIAEFKFIHWQGGAETMRKKALFKDFYRLAEAKTDRRKELYLLGTSHALRFLRSGSGLKSVLSRNVALLKEFESAHGWMFSTVGEYYKTRERDVKIIDASGSVPELVRIVKAVEAPAADEDESEEIA